MSVTNRMNYPIDDHPTLKYFIETHQSMLNYIMLSKGSSSECIFMNQKNVQNITKMQTFLQNEKENSIRCIAELSQTPVMKVDKFFFDDMSLNLVLRKIAFVSQQIHKLKLQLNNLKLNLYMEKEEETKGFMELICSPGVLPDDCLCKIEQFFIVDYPQDIANLNFKVDALNNYLITLNKKIKESEVPLWAKNFNKFFSDILKEEVNHYNEELCYISSLNSEVSISRAIFNGFNDLQPKIDELIDSYWKPSDEEFSKTVLDKCFNFIPDYENMSLKEQSIGILLMFRIVFERFYERYQPKIFNNPTEEQLKMINELSNKPISLFSLPEDSSPQIKDSNMSIREVFQSNEYYLASIQFFNEVSFHTNPIDMLYYTHRTLLSINKAALMQRIKIGEASVDDITNILCFDDMFTLFSCVFFSSDLVEFFPIYNFISKFSPTFCLSNPFEYAQAAIESLAMHVKTFYNQK